MTTNDLSGFIGHWLPQLEAEMRSALYYPTEKNQEGSRESNNPNKNDSQKHVTMHYGMMHYHMGWTDAEFQPQQLPKGKRIRPILCLLACAEVGGDPSNALPAAVAIELLHNFSLMHDDIEDGDEMRRHRATAWTIWGVSQAINTGDAMFALSFATLQQLQGRGVSAKTTLRALDIFTRTCLMLTEGQHLDMHFEKREQVQIGEYMRMIEGKTAALIGASIAIGALIGGATPQQEQALQHFGQALGLEFQIQDDILGIWGDSSVTGKASGNDILRKKQSLPLLHALNHPTIGPLLRQYWSQSVTAEQLPTILDLLDEAGTREFCEQQRFFQHETAINALHKALGECAEQSALFALADSLLNRRS
ncbi:polyprenyl synthetase family protein [Chloroflexi bacterium TSY]|nr:polyprenyl synthetase family protein [Chloroflexi bacterium TSY]